MLSYSRMLLALFLLALVGVLPMTPPVQAQEAEICFEEVPHCVRGRLAEFWQANGGLTVFGLPITPQREEMIEGQPRQVQWFQRNRLELHPENAPPYDVLIGRVGVDVLEMQGRNWYEFPKQEPSEDLTCQYFPETGFNVCDQIFAIWRSFGIGLDDDPGISFDESLALFGLPISGEMTETLSDGNEYTVQYFERARFERHPENEFPFTVLLGLLGSEILLDPETGLPREEAASPPDAGSTPPSTANANPHSFLDLAGTLLFVADDGVHGRELWRSDGTPEGTVLVRDLLSGAEGGTPFQLTVADTTAFFVADGAWEDGTPIDRVLWRSDGTENGTVWVVSPETLRRPTQLTASGDRLFFVAERVSDEPQLWVTDGSEAGTRQLTDVPGGIYPRQTMPMGYVPFQLADVNGTLFLTADDGERGHALWKSDGTPQGTVFVSRLIEGELSPEFYELTAQNDTLFFIARTGRFDYGLWRSDGTAAGTELVRMFARVFGPDEQPPLRLYPHVGGLESVGGLVYLSVGAGGTGADYAPGLWRSDGSLEGTFRISEVAPSSALVDLKGTPFFLARQDGTVELWRSDGTEAGTVAVTSIPLPAAQQDAAYIIDLISIDDQMYITINAAQDTQFLGGELWRSDGTAEGTLPVSTIAGYWGEGPGVVSDRIAGVNGTLFLVGNDLLHGAELWHSSGTPEGTVLVRDINTRVP